MVQLVGAYRARPIRFLELWEESGWRMKVYWISYQGPEAKPKLVAAAKQVARQQLPQPAVTPSRYGVGFLGVHEGRGLNFVFVDWWADENELHHHWYSSPPEKPEALESGSPTGQLACVWDLRVLGFERQAWVETVLANPNGPDLEAYLARRLNEDV